MEAEVNGERHKIGTWDAGHILGPNLGGKMPGSFILCKFIGLYT